MSHGLDKIPLPPQYRVPALIGVAAVGFTLQALLCCGVISLFFSRSEHQVQGQAAQPADLPPILGQQVQVAIDNKRRGVAETDSQLSAEGREALADLNRLLTAAARSPNGKIWTQDGSKLTVAVGSQKFCTDQVDARRAARWRMVLRLLDSQGLIEPVSYPRSQYGVTTTQEWRVTTAGYSLADALSK
jgi:hypothetical protein